MRILAAVSKSPKVKDRQESSAREDDVGAVKDYPRARDYVEDDLDQTDHGALRPETARCPEQRT